MRTTRVSTRIRKRDTREPQGWRRERDSTTWCGTALQIPVTGHPSARVEFIEQRSTSWNIELQYLFPRELF